MRLAWSATRLLRVRLLALSFALLSAGCASEQLAATATSPQKLDINGRWILAVPDAPTCGMLFESAADGLKGIVTPDGGCPGRFYTSRQWQLSQGQLTIIDRDSQSLAQLSFASGQFKGQSSDGMPVTLRR
jgi:hypothetical protein